jgi:hypothetical protein
MKENLQRKQLEQDTSIKELQRKAIKSASQENQVAIPADPSSVDLGANSISKVKRIVRDETEHIFDFIQEYVNEIAMDCIYSIKSDLKTTTQKMDCLDWLARNIEFVSLKLFDKLVKVCISLKDDVKNPKAKAIMFNSPHSSTVLVSLRRLVIETQDSLASEGIKK